MENLKLSNETYIENVVNGMPNPAYVLLPHESLAVERMQQNIADGMAKIVKAKIEVTGGDDWHDGAFRATDNEAKVMAERNAGIAPFLGATVVSYPETTETRVTLGSRTFIKQNGFEFPVDVVGFRKGYPNDVIDESSDEEVTGVSPESPLGQAILGKSIGDETTYKNGERTMKVSIARIDQTAVKQYFMAAAEVELGSSEG